MPSTGNVTLSTSLHGCMVPRVLIHPSNTVNRTNKYGFPCFFVVIKTALGLGRVVGTIIPQFETTTMISRGLEIIKSWNPQWDPKYFMTDKSYVELEAIVDVFPSCIR